MGYNRVLSYIETYSIEILRKLGDGPPLREEYEIQVESFDEEENQGRSYEKGNRLNKGEFLLNNNIGTEGIFTVIHHTIRNNEFIAEGEDVFGTPNKPKYKLAKLHIKSDTILDIQFKEVSIEAFESKRQTSPHSFDSDTYDQLRSPTLSGAMANRAW